MKITLYCKCGGAWRGIAGPATVIEKLKEIFWQAHHDPGCGPCSAAEAAQARRAFERGECLEHNARPHGTAAPASTVQGDVVQEADQ